MLLKVLPLPFEEGNIDQKLDVTTEMATDTPFSIYIKQQNSTVALSLIESRQVAAGCFLFHKLDNAQTSP